MEPIGHVGMALIFASPVWFVYRPAASVLFTALAVVAGVAPDSDIYLKAMVDIAHHGITHTVTFVVGLAAAFGLAAAAIAVVQDRNPRAAGTFAAVAAVVGAGSHLFADLLTTPDVAPPLKPFLPFSDQHVIVDVIYVYSDVWNLFPFIVGLLAHVTFAVVNTDGARLHGFRAFLNGGERR